MRCSSFWRTCVTWSITLLLCSLTLGVPRAGADEPVAGKREIHCFLLSGQSNMVGLREDRFFTPFVRKAFPNNRVIVVKAAKNGKPISDWYAFRKKNPRGPTYHQLMRRLSKQLGGERCATVTFVWMQGESDAKKRGGTYAASLQGLLRLIKEDLKVQEINLVLGRLSDYESADYPQWEMVRRAQMQVADAHPRGVWIDTDDLNGKQDALHYTASGYKELGRRFARRSIELLKRPAH